MRFEATVLFSALAHDTRLRCLMLLMQNDELCVCELTYALGASQPHVSRHLAQLREMGLVADRRSGLWVHYRIHPGLPEWAQAVLRETVAGLRREAPFSEDHRVLAGMPNRPGTVRWI
ncbi:putative transcriptional regulator [Thioflavicoccus mobilis 8321]|uniref:Putative transcriptional regulator n=1 Tax=Thioflavicoccus mobilis 8321 TaxID=765912 RepID=L0GXU9_9GAMM|nr:metalloregulator ArsR/SmtB family transcription factor [Thioflavicoccus mobilis]AGA90652.1 putative transcriptional regulator [Thioflavicoccus mobilis 8321]